MSEAPASLGALPPDVAAAPEARLDPRERARAEREMRLRRLGSVVANFYGVDDRALLSGERDPSLVIPRQVAMYLMYWRIADSRLADVGRLFHRHHTTVWDSIRRVKDRALAEEWLRQDIRELEARLGEPAA